MPVQPGAVRLPRAERSCAWTDGRLRPAADAEEAWEFVETLVDEPHSDRYDAARFG